jgi:hypothetical protein
MAQIKTMAMWLADFLGISATLLGWVNNLDTIKSTILFLTGFAYLLVRGYFYIKKNNQIIREKEYDLWDREQKKKQSLKS